MLLTRDWVVTLTCLMNIAVVQALTASDTSQNKLERCTSDVWSPLQTSHHRFCFSLYGFSNQFFFWFFCKIFLQLFVYQWECYGLENLQKLKHWKRQRSHTTTPFKDSCCFAMEAWLVLVLHFLHPYKPLWSRLLIPAASCCMILSPYTVK